MTRQGILDGLHARLRAYPGLPDVSWLGVPYTPTKGVSYVSPRLSGYNRSTVGAGVHGTVQHDGSYTVAVWASAEDGEAVAGEIAGELVDWFGRHAVVTDPAGRAVVLLNATEQPSMLSGSWISIPVVVTFTASDP